MWKRTYLLVAAAVITALALPSCTPDLDQGVLPVITIDTEKGIRPDVKRQGQFTLSVNGKELVRSFVGVEFRGSTSYRLSDKKSYGLELQNESGDSRAKTLLGLPAESDWILMGHVFRATGDDEFYAWDPTLMHHYLGYELARDIGMYAARCRYVELEVNGEYQGIYVLMEKLKSDPQRIDVSDPGNGASSVTGGYILKIDKTASYAPTGQELSYYDGNWGDDASYSSYISFRSAYDIEGAVLESDLEPFRPPYHDQQHRETYFLHEFPKPRDLTFEQRDYIEQYVYDFERALANETFNGTGREYLQYVDLESFVDGFIMNELAGNIDAYRISTFLHKPRGEKLHFGPIWDLNIGYGRQGRVPWDDWIANYNDYVATDAWMVPFWWQKWLQDPVFKALVKERWGAYRADVLSNEAVLGLVDETRDDLKETGALARNYERWRTPNATVDYDSEVDFLRSYLTQRLAWMDGEIGSW